MTSIFVYTIFFWWFWIWCCCCCWSRIVGCCCCCCLSLFVGLVVASLFWCLFWWCFLTAVGSCTKGKWRRFFETSRPLVISLSLRLENHEKTKENKRNNTTNKRNKWTTRWSANRMKKHQKKTGAPRPAIKQTKERKKTLKINGRATTTTTCQPNRHSANTHQSVKPNQQHSHNWAGRNNVGAWRSPVGSLWDVSWKERRKREWVECSMRRERKEKRGRRGRRRRRQLTSWQYRLLWEVRFCMWNMPVQIRIIYLVVQSARNRKCADNGAKCTHLLPSGTNSTGTAHRSRTGSSEKAGGWSKHALHTMYLNPVGVDRVGFWKKPKVEKKEEQA